MNSEALGQETLTVLKVHQGTVYKLVKEGRFLPSRSAQTGDFKKTR
jgi:hypothetical protein